MPALFEVILSLAQLAGYAAVAFVSWIVAATWYGSFVWAARQGHLWRALLCLIPATGIALLFYQFAKNRYGHSDTPGGVEIKPSRNAVDSLIRAISWKL